MSFRVFAVLAVTTCFFGACGPKSERIAPDSSAETADSQADSRIREQLANQFARPERRKWQIEYRVVEGLRSTSRWHIAGTMWWVRVYPEIYSLDSENMSWMDRAGVYEIDAIALGQNYGVIDFYVFDSPRRLR